jgi:hypothetical protein
MPKVSRESAELHDYGPVEERKADVNGNTIQFLTFKEDADGTPLLKGLPGDNCHCTHWGYVFKGRARFRFPDREEVYEAGDAFYLEPGHIPVIEAGTEYLQFSPAKELAEVSEHMMQNFQALMQNA